MVQQALPWAERLLNKLLSKEACLVSGVLVTVVGLLTQNGSMDNIAVVAGNFFVQRQQRGGGLASTIFVFVAAVVILAIGVLFCMVAMAAKEVCWQDLEPGGRTSPVELLGRGHAAVDVQEWCQLRLAGPTGRPPATDERCAWSRPRTWRRAPTRSPDPPSHQLWDAQLVLGGPEL